MPFPIKEKKRKEGRKEGRREGGRERGKKGGRKERKKKKKTKETNFMCALVSSGCCAKYHKLGDLNNKHLFLTVL
jgi:hypothetical protein